MNRDEVARLAGMYGWKAFPAYRGDYLKLRRAENLLDTVTVWWTDDSCTRQYHALATRYGQDETIPGGTAGLVAYLKAAGR